MHAKVIAVHAKDAHTFSKQSAPAIELIAGHGVSGDAHCGVTVKHRSRVARDPSQPNLRQVHLLHSELFTELAGKGLQVSSGQMGENITTSGLDLLDLTEGAVLQIGSKARVQVTGLRNPCSQIETFMPGLLAAVLGRTHEGELVRKAGVMGIVLESGEVRPGDVITIVPAPERPELHRPLRPV